MTPIRSNLMALLVAFVALSIPVLASAEVASPPFALGPTEHNFFGIGAGMNLSSFSNMMAGASSNTEFQGGVFVDWGMGDAWYLETGLRYNSYSATLNATTTTADFLEIPVLFKPTFNPGGGWEPYFIFGPLFGLKTSESTTNGSGQSSSGIYNTFNLAADLGVGTEMRMTSSFRLFVQFDYALGVIQIANSSNPDNGGGTTYTRGANLTAGVMMPF